MIGRDQPLAIFMEGALGEDIGKMGYGVLRYSPNPVSCVIDSRFRGGRLSDVVETPRDCAIVGSIAEAKALGAEVLILGIANSGGVMPPEWLAEIDKAVEAGMSVVNGLHDRLSLRYTNLKEGQRIWDIRQEPEGLMPGKGLARHLTNTRVLMIGTDMAVGKMTAGLEIYRAAREQGVNAEFIATGQIGITVTGRGVPLDAVRVDFASGAIEREVLAVSDADLVIVEGQGALIHPGSTANLPLLRGSCPTHLVLCVRAGQTHLRRLPEIEIPPLKEYIQLYEELGAACGTLPRPKCVAVCANTFGLGEEEARSEVDRIRNETGLATTDPVRFGVDEVVVALTIK